MNLTTQLRLILLVCGVVLLLGMYWFGRRKSNESAFKAQRFDPHHVEDDPDEDSLPSFEDEVIEQEPVITSDVPARTRSLQPLREARNFAERLQLRDEAPFDVEPFSASRTEPVWHDEELSATPSSWQEPDMDEAPAAPVHSMESDTINDSAQAKPLHEVVDWQNTPQPVLHDAVALNSDDAFDVESPAPSAPPVLMEEAAAVDMPIIADPVPMLEPEPEPAPRLASRPVRAAPAAAPASRKIMALRLAFTSERVSGEQLLSLLQGERLQLGKFNIFHRLHDQQSVFSVASMVEPGTFDLDTMPSQHYVGVTFFTMLPGVMEAPMMFEQMLGCAQRVAQATGGTLQDERGSKLSPYIVERLRDEVLDFQHLLGRANVSVTADTV